MLIYDKHVIINRLLLNMATCVVYNMTQVMIRSNGGKFKRHVRELCLVEEAKEVDE
jgi:hypothetical protein